MLRFLVALILLAPLAAGQPFDGLVVATAVPAELDIVLHAESLYVYEVTWVRLADTGDVHHDFSAIGTWTGYTNATMTLDSRPGDDFEFTVFAQGGRAVGDLDRAPHNHTARAVWAPGMSKADVYDVRDSCLHAGDADLSWRGDTNMTVWGYSVVIEADEGSDKYATGFNGATWTQGIAVGNTASTVRINATGVAGDLTSLAASTQVYHGLCPTEPPASIDERAADVAAPDAQSLEPEKPHSTALPVEPEPRPGVSWPGLVVAAGVVAALGAMPWRRIGERALARQHYRTALAFSLLAWGNRTNLIHARALDGCRLHARAAATWKRIYRKTSDVEAAERAAISHAKAGQGVEAATWLLVADRARPGVMGRVAERHFLSVSSDDAFRAVVRHLMGAADVGA